MNNVIYKNSGMKKKLSRRQRERSEMRLRVLDAARDLFLSGGEEAVTLRRVAEEIEYSATTIYLYFPNKEALICELCSADFAAYSRVLQQAERTPDPLTRLRKMAAAYLDFGLLYPAHYRAMFITAASLKSADGEKESKVVPTGVENITVSRRDSPTPASPYDFLHTAVFKAMAAGCFKPQYRDVGMIAQVIWSGLHGVISLHLVRARYAAVSWRPVQNGAELMVECLISGLTGEEA